MTFHRCAIAYVRVSTDKQIEGNGFDIQLAKIRAYAKARSIVIKRTFREAGSGVGEDSIMERPELQKALLVAKKKGWPIFVAQVSRVGRDEESVVSLVKDPAITIISVENGVQADQAVIAAQAQEAEQTAKIISRTTKASLRKLKKQGVLLGNPVNLGEAQKLGAKANADRFRKRAEEYLPVVQKIDPDGAKTRMQIVDALNERGLRTDRGHSWTVSTFRRLHDEIKRLRRIAAQQAENEQSFEEKQRKDPMWGMFA